MTTFGELKIGSRFRVPRWNRLYGPFTKTVWIRHGPDDEPGYATLTTYFAVTAQGHLAPLEDDEPVVKAPWWRFWR